MPKKAVIQGIYFIIFHYLPEMKSGRSYLNLINWKTPEYSEQNRTECMAAQPSSLITAYSSRLPSSFLSLAKTWRLQSITSKYLSKPSYTSLLSPAVTSERPEVKPPLKQSWGGDDINHNDIRTRHNKAREELPQYKAPVKADPLALLP